MANKEIATLFVEMRATFAKFSSDIQQVSKSVTGVQKSLQKSLKGVDKLVNAIVGVTVIVGIKKLNSALGELARKGDEFQDLTENFEKLGGSSLKLQAAQSAVMGTVSAIDLMKIANEGLLKQIPAFNDNFVKIADLGGRVAQALGVDAKDGINQVVDALGSAKTKQLEAIGITIDADKAYREYAKSIGVAAKELNNEQQKEARQIAAIQSLDQALGRLAPMADSVADAQTALGVALEDAFAQMGTGVNDSNELRDAYREMAKAVGEVDWKEVGASLGELAAILMNTLVPAFGYAIDRIDDFVRGLKVLQQLPAFDFDLDATQQAVANSEALNKQTKAAQDAAVAMKKLKDVTVFEGDNFTLTQEGLKKAASAVRDLEDAVARGGPLTEKYADALSHAKDNVKNYTVLLGDSIPIAAKHGDVSQKSLDAAAKSAEKAAKEIANLKDKWAESVEQINQKSLEEPIKEQIEKAIEGVDSASFENLKKQLADAVQDGYVKKWEEAIKKGAVSEADVRAQAARVAEIETEEWSEKFENKSKEAYENSIETWRSLFENAITGTTFNLKDALEQVAVGFAAQMAQSLVGSLGGIDIKSGADLGGAIFNQILGGASKGGLLEGLGLSGGVGGLLGSFGMSGAAAQAAGIAGPAMESGMFASGTGMLGALGPWGLGAAAGIGLLGATGGFDKIGDLFGGGPKNKETVARNDVLGKLEEMLSGKNFSFFDKQGKMGQRFTGNLISGGSSKFNKPGWADEFNKTQNANLFGAIGEGLTNLLGITEDVGPQIGAILSENLNDNIDNARILMAQLGVSEEDMTAAFVKAGEQETMSWHAVEVAIQGVSQAFGEGLSGFADLSGSFQQIIDSGGDGMDAILALKNSAVEAGEAGVENFEEWKKALLDTGANAGYVEAFFQALGQRNISTLDQITDASSRTLGAVIADMQSASPELASVWIAAQEEAQKYLDTVAKIPDDSTKHVTLNVDANISDDARKTLSAMDSDIEATATPFATGGIVKKPTLGLIGEAGPEAVLPLSHLKGMMQGMTMQEGGGKSVNVVINAQGAQPGVEESIRRVIRDLQYDIQERVVDRVIELGRRAN